MRVTGLQVGRVTEIVAINHTALRKHIDSLPKTHPMQINHKVNQAMAQWFQTENAKRVKMGEWK